MLFLKRRRLIEQHYLQPVLFFRRIYIYLDSDRIMYSFLACFVIRLPSRSPYHRWHCLFTLYHRDEQYLASRPSIIFFFFRITEPIYSRITTTSRHIIYFNQTLIAILVYLAVANIIQSIDTVLNLYEFALYILLSSFFSTW